MPPEPLPRIPTASDVFVDSNILVYAIEGRSPQCLSLLERCLREKVTGICSYSVVIEATHQFMISDARKNGLLPAPGRSPAKYLKEHPQIVRSLRAYWADAQRIFSLNLLFLEADEAILKQAQLEREDTGLRTMDSVIVSHMREYGIGMLATNDADFERVAGIHVFQPTDI